jgi:hypothetical protein
MSLGGNWLYRIRRPVFVWALIALITQLAVERGLDRQAVLPGTTKGQLLALLPLLPALLFLFALVRLVQQMDELQKRICLESVFIAFIGTLILAFVFGGLEQAGVYRSRWDAGETMMALFACAYIYSSWKYR